MVFALTTEREAFLITAWEEKDRRKS